MAAAYSLFTLPHMRPNLDFRKLTPAEAKENVVYFVPRVPERLRMLTEVVRQELPAWRPDLSDESLGPLGEWYDRHAEMSEVSAERRERLRGELGPLGDLADVIPGFTALTVSLGIDIGIYLAECVRMRCPETGWRLHRSWKVPAVMGPNFEKERAFPPIAQARYLTDVASRRRLQNALKGVALAAPQTLAEHHVAMQLRLPTKEPRAVLGAIIARAMMPPAVS